MVSKAEALAMGMHDRLGAESPLYLLNHWLLERVARMGCGDYEVGFKGFHANGLTNADFYFPLDGTLVELPPRMKPAICDIGFHYCHELRDVDRYYLLDEPTNVFAEVAAMGRVVTDRTKRKSACTMMQVIRILPKQEVMKAASGPVDLPPPPPPPQKGYSVITMPNNMPDGSVVRVKYIEYHNGSGILNNPPDGGPAIRTSLGGYTWVDDESGLPHRDEHLGPAIFHPKFNRAGIPGDELPTTGPAYSYYKGGQLHRNIKAGPAHICAYANKYYIRIYAEEGLLHNEKRPAVVFARHFFIFADHGVIHRDVSEGPAIYLPCGIAAWVDHGRLVTLEMRKSFYKDKRDRWPSWPLEMVSYFCKVPVVPIIGAVRDAYNACGMGMR